MLFIFIISYLVYAYFLLGFLMNVPYRLKLTASLYLLLFFIPVCSVIIQAEVLSIKHADRSQRYCYLLHNVHKAASSDDARQLSEMIHILQDREIHSTDRLHIFVEKPYSLSAFWSSVLQSPKTIAGDLIDQASSLGFHYTTFENAEIRAASLGALHALQTDENPNEIYDGVVLDSGEKTMLLKDITVQSLLNEYKFYSSQIDQIEFVDSRIQEVIKREFVYLNNFFDVFVKNLAYLKIQQNETVIALAQRLYNSGLLREKAVLFSSIARLFTHLFDLFVFKRMVKSDMRHIALVAGCAHTQHLADMFISAGGRLCKRCGMSFHCQPQGVLIALCKDQLNVFMHQRSLAHKLSAVYSYCAYVTAVAVICIISYIFWTQFYVA